MSKSDQELMKLADEMASQSKSRTTPVGSVIVDKNDHVCASAFNSFPNGVNDQIDERHSRENGEKYFWSVCAERNAIYSAAKKGISLEGSKIYITTFSYPCPECVKAIIQSGIKEVVAVKDQNLSPYQIERYTKLFERSATMLKEAGIIVRHI